MNIPSNLKYSSDHEWLRVEGENAVIGITDFAQHELGDIVFVDVTSVGETFAKSEIFGSIEAVKTVSDLMLPISGEIIEFNDSLESAPDAINKDPYNAGWIVKVKMSNPAEVNDLMDTDTYKAFIGA